MSRIGRREPIEAVLLRRTPDGSVTDDTADYEAIVYDLDGTLVDLVVSWDEVAADAVEFFADAGVDASGHDLWEMLDLADERGLREELEAVVAGHERDGATVSELLALAEDVADHSVPVGVCSLNSEAAVRAALDAHSLSEHVDAVVGRDTVATRKPDPEPLLATLRELGVEPERALFVGDSRRDELTAERAGVDFRYVDGGPSGH
ncbi:HAD family hydrolase [Halegenticoccus tardaugens]|uniref:HAD family hydrolase n=1 Tax=Halegenticoccus tardaugens TaxID=2071624 RepID=UPI00100A463C|nr:HAD family hydrolase [Halegenticoccus tardaugens]